MINIIIPMAGKGSRFDKEGYTTRKPFLDFLDTFMVHKVLENLTPTNKEHKFHLIMNNVDVENEQEKVNKLKEDYNVEIYIIDYYTEGPVMSILHAKKNIDNNDELVIANSDQYIDFDFDDFLEKSSKYTGSLLTFKDPEAEPKWSFVAADENDEISKVVAKEVISEDVVVGIYYWNKGSEFVDNAIKLIINNDRANNEFFQCPVYNYAIKDDKKVLSYSIAKEQMYALGVPKDFEESIEKLTNK